jgi:hypothetical protein
MNGLRPLETRMECHHNQYSVVPFFETGSHYSGSLKEASITSGFTRLGIKQSSRDITVITLWTSGPRPSFIQRSRPYGKVLLFPRKSQCSLASDGSYLCSFLTCPSRAWQQDLSAERRQAGHG